MDATTHAVEIRSYALKPGMRDAFHRLMSEAAIPMLHRWQVDVVAHGPSPHDADAYYLIRRYRDLAERETSQDAFMAVRNGTTGRAQRSSR
jgi:hypothetical protein